MKQELQEKEYIFREKYYNTPEIQDKLVNAMLGREVVFMDRLDNWKCIRCLCIRNISMLNYFFNNFDFFDRDYNIYISVAYYKFIPEFTINLRNRRKETSYFFRDCAYRYIDNYDILLDFDLKTNFKRLKNEVIRFLESITIFSNYKILTSGTGLQVIIYDFTFNNTQVFVKYDNDKVIGFNQMIKKYTEYLKNRYKLAHLCLNGIGGLTKIRKCEYSLVGSTEVKVLTLEELKKFEYEVE